MGGRFTLGYDDVVMCGLSYVDNQIRELVPRNVKA